MLRIAVCDDQKLYLNEISEACKRYFSENAIEYSLEEYTDGNELISKAAFDIVILDVEMPALSGIDVKNYIERNWSNTKVLFVSSHPESMPDAFGDNVSGFLVKPLEYDKLADKLDKIILRIRTANRVIRCNTSVDIYVELRLKDILYIHAEGRYSQVYKTDGEDIFIIKSFKSLETELSEEFVKCHRSYIVNMENINSIKDDVIRMKDGKELPIGKTVKKMVKEKYGKYLLRR